MKNSRWARLNPDARTTRNIKECCWCFGIRHSTGTSEILISPSLYLPSTARLCGCVFRHRWNYLLPQYYLGCWWGDVVWGSKKTTTYTHAFIFPFCPSHFTSDWCFSKSTKNLKRFTISLATLKLQTGIIKWVIKEKETLQNTTFYCCS